MEKVIGELIASRCALFYPAPIQRLMGHFITLTSLFDSLLMTEMRMVDEGLDGMSV